MKRRKIIAILLAAVTVFATAVLVVYGTHNVDKTTTSPSSAITQEQSKNGDLTVPSSTKKEKETTSGKRSDSSDKASTTTAKTRESTTSTKTTKQNGSTTESKTKTPSSSKPSGTTTVKEASTTAEPYCYITIECSSILSNMDDLARGHEQYIPSDGYILKNYACKMYDGDSVYDILKRSCQENSIRLNVTSSGFGYYIAGINNIDEKDCGKTSGWLYKVNSVQPPKSCDKYSVSGGDSIVFTYSCHY